MFASLRLNDPPEKHDLFIVPQSSKQNIYPGTKKQTKLPKQENTTENLGGK